jgi:hypothetical protein
LALVMEQTPLLHPAGGMHFGPFAVSQAAPSAAAARQVLLPEQVPEEPQAVNPPVAPQGEPGVATEMVAHTWPLLQYTPSYSAQLPNTFPDTPGVQVAPAASGCEQTPFLQMSVASHGPVSLQVAPGAPGRTQAPALGEQTMVFGHCESAVQVPPATGAGPQAPQPVAVRLQ